jgi:gamma-glutamyltranspeptidase / glutathione hydrolase
MAVLSTPSPRSPWVWLAGALFALTPWTLPQVFGVEEPPAATVNGGVVVATSGPVGVNAGVVMLKKGGSAADAALATSLTQVAQVAGAYVSYAGVLSLMYYDSSTEEVFYLNAGFDTPREEKDPLSIPARASGRTALVPGFMAGVEAAHRRFGKLPFARLFDPALALAEDGVRIDPDMAQWIAQRKDVLARLPETKRVFTKADGSFYADGDLFRQPDLAQTLRRVARDGAGVMYTGDWAKRFVEAVQRDGGKVTLEDLQAYRAVWEKPLRTTFRDHEVCASGFSSREGVNLLEAFNLLEAADLKRRGHYRESPESLFWLAQILGCQDLMWLPADRAKHPHGMDLSPVARLKKETAAAIWERMQKGTWRYSRKATGSGGPRTDHSDAVVAVDRWGNVAALTHTINTNLWGETGLFVDGVSIPDPGALQREQIREAGPGKRLPDTMGPLIVLRDNRPLLASSAIGSGLHEKTVQVLLNLLEFGLGPQEAVDAPYLLPRSWEKDGPVVRVIEDTFDGKVLDGLRANGQPVTVLRKADAGEWGRWRGYWVGVSIDPKTGARRGVPARNAATATESD